MACTKEEIERKRLAALQKKQAKMVNQNTCVVSVSSPVKPILTSKYLQSPSPGPLKGDKRSSTFHPYSKTKQNQESNVPVTKVVSGTVYLISEHRFEVHPSEFCTPLIDIFKTIPSKCYDSKSNLWNFSIDHYQDLMSKVAPLAPHVVLGPLPAYVFKVLKEKAVDPNQLDLSPIEDTLRQKLMTFQEEGVRFGIAHRGRCMIADDMGLGKTFQALAIASYYRHDWPLLIVTTSSMRETWQTKINELLPSVPLMKIVILSSRKDVNLVVDRQTEVVIVSYKITTIHLDVLKNKKFGVIIIDESHFLKSHKAQCTVALAGIARQASRVILLSGTPALSRPAELYTQLALIEPKLFTSYTEYGKRYCAGRQTNFGWDMSGQSNLAELQIILQKRFLIRRTKDQVLTMLEEKTRESVLLDETQLEKGEEPRLSEMADACKRSNAADRHAALITYFSESARVKMPAVCKYIRQLVSEHSGKFLVFAHHRIMLDAICCTLDETSTHYITIVGSTPANIRADLVEKFQLLESCRCAVLSLTAAGAGLTLTAAGLVVFAELHWNPGILTQAESRAHRIGRSGGVCVRYLLARGTADDVMWPLLQNKLNVLNDVGLSTDSFEDAALKHQESNNKITQYLSPIRLPKNKNDYIPGTNIRKNSESRQKKLQIEVRRKSENISQAEASRSIKELDDIADCFLDDMSMETDNFNVESSKNGNTESTNYCDKDDIDKSFLADEEGDELLANLDL
ncbi:SWI/SNF-related matrix-associated actin-dependent regulator of chromatin subfamily A-like protein 1 [Epargyreus clarus]|uniref:SWI/SNF-related matrix-associated actin-dependent regulator of chromatin subfamily A-like protein 1 n=1 Tax=Epargyreus clarus TaxID=520877 RepID=UPI003C2E1CDF